jgi:hypothetical protein
MKKFRISTLLTLALLLAISFLSNGCGDDDDDDNDSIDDDDDSVADDDDDSVGDDDDDDDNNDDNDTSPPTFKVMTFNVGTSTGLRHDLGPDDGYTSQMADIADDLYHNSLSWNPAEQALTAFIAAESPDVLSFQEMFYDPWCEEIAVDPALDFVCKDYSEQRPLQIERLVGPDYQVACSINKEDNCVAVKKSFGLFQGCPTDEPCIGGLDGMGPASGCTSRPRVGRIVIELSGGGEIVLVDIHATSGIKKSDRDCRSDQFEQVFVDRGDGTPAAFGEVNLVMGDINTDPFFSYWYDSSARTWNQYVGDGLGFDYISASSAKETGSYLGGLLHIDQVVSDFITGECVVPGNTAGVAPPMEATYWDHSPVICEVSLVN